MPNLIVQSFNSGELSPKIDARSDVAKYGAGCRVLENFLPLKYGCAERRPGTEYLATAKLSPQGVRMVAFRYNSEIAYEIEFGNEYARFFYDGELIQGADITTPYQVEDLPALQFLQIGDTIRIVGRNYAPRLLSRTSATTFTLTTIAFENGPFLPRNDIVNADNVTMDTNVTTAGSSGTLTASADTFEDEHVGALFQLIHPKDAIAVTCTGTGDDDVAIAVDGTFTFITRGTWTGTVRLQRSFDGGTTWEDFRVYTATNDRNVQLSYKETEDNIQYRVHVDNGLSGTSLGAEISIENTLQKSVFRVDAVTSPTVAQVTCMVAAPATNGLVATKRWAEGCWSMVQGYPSAIGAKDNRVVYGATNTQVSTFWLSAVDDYENFKAGVDDADSFSLTMTTQDEIMWINGLDGLVIGTSGGVWVCRSNKLDTPLTPTNFNLDEYVTFGSAPIQAIKVDNAILYVDKSRRQIREFTFGQSDQEYLAPDLTSLAEHVTKELIVAMAFQQNPDPIMWVCLADGKLLSMTYDREQNVVAWSRHPMGITQGSFMVYPTLREANEMPAITAPDPIGEIALAAETDISTADGLQAIAGSGHYKLTADIDLTGYNWVPIVDFTGVLDGQNHRIFGLNINNPNAGGQGLFRNLSTNAQVRDIIFEDCQVTGGFTSGAPNGSSAILCAYIYDSTAVLVKNITIANSRIGPNLVYASDMSDSGMLIGSVFTSTVDIFNCYVNGCEINGWDNADIGDGATNLGLLIGELFIGGNLTTASNHTVNIVGCQATGTISGLSFIGGLIGYAYIAQTNAGKRGDYNYINIMDCKSSVQVRSGGYYVGGMIGDLRSGTGRYSKGNIIMVANCEASGEITAEPDYTKQYVGGFVGTLQAGSSLTASYNLAALYNCSTAVNISIVADSDVSQMGGFVGYIQASASAATRIFDSTASGNIAIHITGTESTFDIGGFVGLCQGDETVYTYEETGEISWTLAYRFIPEPAGSTIGEFTNTGTGETGDGTIGMWAEGMVLKNGVWYRFYTYGAQAPVVERITSEAPVSSVVYNCQCSGNVNIETQYTVLEIGGFAGTVDTSGIVYCSETGSVVIDRDGKFADLNYEIGGFVGLAHGTGSFFACSAVGDVTVQAASTTLSGSNRIFNSIGDVGGFIGWLDDDAHISDCYSWSDISCTLSHGDTTLTGYTGGTIYNVGGFCGINEASIEHVYSIGTITLSNGLPQDTIYSVGGLIGDDAGSLTRTYWDKEASNRLTSDGGTALTTVQAKTEASYYLWDFDFVWKMKEWGASSICVTPSPGEDRVTIAVARIINGAEVRYIERMKVRAFGKQDDAFFVDCGKTFTGSTTDSVAGLDHLEGEKVKVLGDGSYVGEFTVTQGTVTLPDAFYKIHVGLPYTYKLTPMRFDIDHAGGSTHGSIKKIYELVISFLETLNAMYGRDMEHLFTIDWRTNEPYTTPPAVFTGDKVLSFDGGLDIDDKIVITGNDPFPCTIRALVARLDVTGR